MCALTLRAPPRGETAGETIRRGKRTLALGMIPGVIGRPTAGGKEDSGLPSGPKEASKAASRGEKGQLHGFFTPARLFFHRPDAMIEQRKNKKRPAGGMRFPWRRGVDRIWSG